MRICHIQLSAPLNIAEEINTPQKVTRRLVMAYESQLVNYILRLDRVGAA